MPKKPVSFKVTYVKVGQGGGGGGGGGVGVGGGVLVVPWRKVAGVKGVAGCARWWPP